MKKNHSAALAGVTVYRHLLQLPPLAALTKLFRALEQQDGVTALEGYTETFYALTQEGTDSLADYLVDQLRYGVSSYAQAAAHGQAGPVLTQAAERDLTVFADLAALEPSKIKTELASLVPEDWQDTVQTLPEWGHGPLPTFQALTAFYETHGCGIFSRYQAFVWQDGALHPVKEPDFVPEDAFIGYERQREQVVENTRLLVSGRQVNNVLLYGVSGTGKSATVKGLLGMPEFASLRLIEVPKEELCDIPKLVRDLAHRPQKFIIFIDDLAFDKEDRTFSSLKTILEGGLEPRPVNVAVYCTSNRRHLVRQNFSDRDGDEVHKNDTMEELISLSDRFGLTITFIKPGKDGYLNIVRDLAQQYALSLDIHEVEAAAERFALSRGGRSPRVAKQCVEHLKAMEA